MLDTDYKKVISNVNFNKMIYTGPIDYFFDYQFGKLPYRSIRFEYKNFREEFIQNNAVINYVDKDVDFSRVTEYKYLTGQESESSSVSYEYFEREGEPYYPIPTKENSRLYMKYLELTRTLKSVIFCGRLAEYKYYNMDQVIAKVLLTFEKGIND